MPPLTLAKTSQEVIRFTRFALVGAIGTLLDFAVLTILKEAFGFPTLIANTISYGAGLLNNFTLNRLWTYPESRSKKIWAQLGQFGFVSLIGVLLNNLIVLALEPIFSTWFGSLGYLPAKAVATGLVVFWNFTANRVWTFNDIPRKKTSP